MRNKLLNSYVFNCLLITFLNTACHSSGLKEESSKDEFVTIDARDIKLDQEKSLLLSSFVDSIDIIALEFKEDCILKEIEKINIFGDNIFLIERNNGGGVYRFNINGDYLNRIGERGQGPENTVELADFCLNKEDSTIYLLDNARQLILHYDFNGHFIESIHINQYGGRLAYLDKLFYVYRDRPYDAGSYSLCIRDKQGGLIKGYFPPTDYDKKIALYTNTFNIQEGQLLFYQDMNDTVYSLNGNELSYAYYMDLGNLKLTQDEVRDIYTERIPAIQILLNKERVSGFNGFYKVGDRLFFTKIYKIIQYLFVYDLNTDKLEISSNLWDDLEYMFYSTKFYGQTSDALIGLYETNSLDRDIERFDRYVKEGYISSEIKEKQQQKMKGIRRGDISEDMNPWVLIYKTKTNKQ